jgi:hypothetical protein
MQRPLEKFYAFLDRPLYLWSRVVLAVLAIPLIMALSRPLWKIRLEAPQYPKGMYMDIYAYKLEGGNHGQHIQEINTLNHYIGMHKIDRGELSDLDWIPFALGALVLLTLRCAAVGNVRALVDLVVVTFYVGAFSMVRFVYKLYVFGHNLDPEAPVKVKPFTPAIFGSKQIANFTTHSYPLAGTYLVAIFATGSFVVLARHLIAGRMEAARAEKQADATPPSVTAGSQPA